MFLFWLQSHAHPDVLARMGRHFNFNKKTPWLKANSDRRSDKNYDWPCMLVAQQQSTIAIAKVHQCLAWRDTTSVVNNHQNKIESLIIIPTMQRSVIYWAKTNNVLKYAIHIPYKCSVPLWQGICGKKLDQPASLPLLKKKQALKHKRFLDVGVEGPSLSLGHAYLENLGCMWKSSATIPCMFVESYVFAAEHLPYGNQFIGGLSMQLHCHLTFNLL